MSGHWSVERVLDNLHRYNLLDLRRVDVHFHQLVVVSLILWLILRMGSQHGGFTDLPLVVTDQVVVDYFLVLIFSYGCQEFSSSPYPTHATR